MTAAQLPLIATLPLLAAALALSLIHIQVCLRDTA